MTKKNIISIPLIPNAIHQYFNRSESTATSAIQCELSLIEIQYVSATDGLKRRYIDIVMYYKALLNPQGNCLETW